MHFPQLFAVRGKVRERRCIFAAFSQVSESARTLKHPESLKVAGQRKQVYLRTGFVKALIGPQSHLVRRCCEVVLSQPLNRVSRHVNAVCAARCEHDPADDGLLNV